MKIIKTFVQWIMFSMARGSAPVTSSNPEPVVDEPAPVKVVVNRAMARQQELFEENLRQRKVPNTKDADGTYKDPAVERSWKDYIGMAYGTHFTEAELDVKFASPEKLAAYIERGRKYFKD